MNTEYTVSLPEAACCNVTRVCISAGVVIVDNQYLTDIKKKMPERCFCLSGPDEKKMKCWGRFSSVLLNQSSKCGGVKM